MRNSTDASEIMSYPAVAVRGLQRGYSSVREAVIRDSASATSPTTCSPIRLGIRSRLTGIFLAIVGFLVMLFAGCADGQVPADDSSERAASSTDGGQPSLVAFPRHDYPLGTDRGGEYLAGRLVLSEGCLRIEVPADNSDDIALSLLVIWPSAYKVEETSRTVRVMDGMGRTAARAGDHVRLSWAPATYQEAKPRELVTGLSEHCPDPSFLVGEEVTVFDPENEATELRLSDPAVLFLRQRTEISANRGFMDAAGIGELVLDGQCLRLDGVATILWPAGFTPHAEDGVVHVRNGAGRTIVKVGDEIAGGGGYFNSRYGECPGEIFMIHEIKVLPDVEVYFPKQEEALKQGQVMKGYVGELVLNGKCLGVRVSGGSIGHEPALLVWPRTFELNVEDGAVEIIKATGGVVAKVGDEVRFSAFTITYDYGSKPGALEEITPACTGPYLAVGEDFTAVETP